MKNSHHYAISRQAGNSLLESVLVALVIVIAIITALALFTNVFSTSKVQTESQYVSEIRSEVQGIFAMNRDYGSGDITQTLINTRAAPGPMIVGSTLRNSWGGLVQVQGVSDRFSIAEQDVPKKECVKLAQVNVDPQSVTINGANVQLPMDPMKVVQACSMDKNYIAWTFR